MSDFVNYNDKLTVNEIDQFLSENGGESRSPRISRKRDRSDGSDGSDEGEASRNLKKRGFRKNCRGVGLTFSFQNPGSPVGESSSTGQVAEVPLPFACLADAVAFKNDLYDHLVSFETRLGEIPEVMVCLEHHENGMPHFHAGVWRKKPFDIRSPDYFDFRGWHCNIHPRQVEKYPGGDWWDYLQKDDEEVRTNIRLPVALYVPEIYGWQRVIVKEVAVPCDPKCRKVHWIWSSLGAVGKTSLARYLCIRHGAMYVSGKASDMKYAISEFIKEHKRGPDICILNVSRAAVLPTGAPAVSYTGIEELKDALFFSTKYEACMRIFNTMHLLVFANQAPDIDLLSEDRWSIRELSRSRLDDRTVVMTRTEI